MREFNMKDYMSEPLFCQLPLIGHVLGVEPHPECLVDRKDQVAVRNIWRGQGENPDPVTVRIGDLMLNPAGLAKFRTLDQEHERSIFKILVESSLEVLTGRNRVSIQEDIELAAR